MADGVKLHPGWLEPLKGEFDSPYMQALKGFLTAEKEAGKRIFCASPFVQAFSRRPRSSTSTRSCKAISASLALATVSSNIGRARAYFC